MSFISKEQLKGGFSIASEELISIPNFICPKHWNLCRIMIKPEGVDISCNECDKDAA